MIDWIRRVLPARSRSIDTELKNLEQQATTAQESARGQIFNRAGDLAFGAGMTHKALVYYGRAVDAYLEAGYLGPAKAMCRKILRAYPGAVRAHCTLACLAAHGEHVREVEAEIRFFVDASKRTRTERLTIPRLRLLGDAVQDPQVKELVAGVLAEMGDALGSERIRVQMQAEAALADSPPSPEELQWQKLVRAAALDPDELWKYA